MPRPLPDDDDDPRAGARRDRHRPPARRRPPRTTSTWSSSSVPAGSFQMGSPRDEWGARVDETQHQVTITRPFYLATTEVTQRQWRALAGANPSYLYDCPDCPVEGITWLAAVAFCNAFSAQAGLTPAYTIVDTVVTWDRDVRRLPAADRGGVGVRLPRGHVHAVQHRRLPDHRPGQLRRLRPDAGLPRGAVARSVRRGRAASRPTPGTCTTCTATSRSCAGTGTPTTGRPGGRSRPGRRPAAHARRQGRQLPRFRARLPLGLPSADGRRPTGRDGSACGWRARSRGSEARVSPLTRREVAEDPGRRRRRPRGGLRAAPRRAGRTSSSSSPTTIATTPWAAPATRASRRPASIASPPAACASPTPS